MNQKKLAYEDEIDLMEIFLVLWNGKWRIIGTTIVATIIGFTYSIYQPESFVVSTPIQKGKASVFVEFKPINDVLLENELLLTEDNLNGYLIDAPTIFKTFINEFNDYEEMIEIIRKDSFVKNVIADLDNKQKKQSLIGYAKFFEISPVFQDKQNTMTHASLLFKWHNVSEGQKLFEDALNLTLINVKKSLLNDIDKLASSIDLKIQRELENLFKELSMIQQKQQLDDTIRIQYLKEQSAIAKELDIEKNQLDSNSLLQSQSSLSLQSQTSKTSSISLNVDPNNFPYYLRGYRAIDKEISIIQNRSTQEQLLIAKGYDEIRKKILSLENDLSSSQLRSFLKAIENDNPNDWIEFDLTLSDSKSENNFNLFVILSTVLGLIISLIYTLISSAISRYKENI